VEGVERRGRDGPTAREGKGAFMDSSMGRAESDGPEMTDLEVELAAGPSCAADARREADHFLTERGLHDLRAAAALVVSELVSNAAEHGEGSLRLVMHVETIVRIEVSDRNPRTDQIVARAAEPCSARGRGLHVVTRLARRWGVAKQASGKKVWAELLAPEHATFDGTKA